MARFVESESIVALSSRRPRLPALSVLYVNSRYIELDSDKGHLASGADAALWSDDLKRFLEQPV
jgi:hypothetical protein